MSCDGRDEGDAILQSASARLSERCGPRTVRARAGERRARKELSIGGLIEIHGEGGRGTNWTDGCIAVRNAEMDGLFEALSVGSAMVIVGSYDGIRTSGGGK